MSWRSLTYAQRGGLCYATTAHRFSKRYRNHRRHRLLAPTAEHHVLRSKIASHPVWRSCQRGGYNGTLILMHPSLLPPTDTLTSRKLAQPGSAWVTVLTKLPLIHIGNRHPACHIGLARHWGELDVASGITLRMNWSKSGTVKAVSPCAGLYSMPLPMRLLRVGATDDTLTLS